MATPAGPEYGVKYTLTGPDGTIAVFNESSDPNFVGTLSPESSGLDSADVRESAVDAVEEDGGVHGNFYYGRRPVVLQGTIIATSAKDRNEKAAKIQAASNAMRGDATLKWKPTGGEELELKLRRQQPVRITKGFVKEFQIPMVSADAFIKGAVHNTYAYFGEALLAWLATPTTGVVGVAVDTNYVYWSDTTKSAIGRAKLDGSSPEAEWIKTPVTPARITVDSTHIYWGDTGLGTIGRAKLDGSSPEAEWIKTPEIPEDIVVNSIYIYWADSSGGITSIGRAKLDGSSPEAEWIKTPSKPVGVAINATYIYWADETAGTIGRAKLDGSSPEAEWIKTPVVPIGVDVDSTNVYWADSSIGAIGRAKLDGSSPEAEWITAPTTPKDVTISSTYIYWTDTSTEGVLGRSGKYTSGFNFGSAPAYPIIKVYGPGKVFKLENATTKQYITLEGVELKEGEYFEVDFKNHTVLKNGTTYAYSALIFAASTWWALEPGENKVVITGGLAEVAWQDAWV